MASMILGKAPSCLRLILFTILALVLRKVYLGHEAMTIVRQCGSQVGVDVLMKSSELQRVINMMGVNQPVLVLLLNRHALNMTLNWLCNTEQMQGVHGHSLIVTLDRESDNALARLWPKVQRLHWHVPCLQEPFNYGDGKYQLLYLFRSNLAQILLSNGLSFWMIQQDTFWSDDLLQLLLPSEAVNADIVFDRASESSGPLIAGGYYYARPTSGAKAFFRSLSTDLEWWYAPDNAYMTSLCSRQNLARCAYIPFNTITNWIWLHEPSRVVGLQPPRLIQFDGYTKLGSKLNHMQRLGFYFLQSDGETCNSSSVESARMRVRNFLTDARTMTKETHSVRSYSHLQFSLYQLVIDQLYRFRVTEWFLNSVIYPYAHYFMITL